MRENTESTTRYAGLFRRLMAIIYDLFLLIALLFIATAAAMVLNQGNAIQPGQPLYPFYVVYLLIISFIFYGWFWTHGGQTLGMKTWKMKLQQENGQAALYYRHHFMGCRRNGFPLVSFPPAKTYLA